MTYIHLIPAPPPPPTHPWQCMWGCGAHANDMDTLRDHERECEQRPIGVATVNERHTYALTHPLNTASGGRETIEPYRQVEPQPDGNLLGTVLAVDR